MRFTFGWLKENLDFDGSPLELCEKLTSIGLEVENFSDPKDALCNFIVSKIINIEKHPDADKLSVCEVYDGKDRLQIVCGAQNARKNLTTVLAPIGSEVRPNSNEGFTITKSKIRGVESYGMLCSEEELGLQETVQGIIELTDDLKIGSKFSEHIDDEQISFEIAITPNRVDCAGVYGIARDLSAVGWGKLKEKKIPCIETDFETTVKLNNTLKTNKCPQFSLRLIKDVKNIQSPKKLIKRFDNSGIKVISSLVDVTNFFTFDYCRPLHVFDFDKIIGNIKIRESKEGEKFIGLDDEEYFLHDGMIVICDEEKIISLAGVLGGKNTACDEHTKNILLESAYFLPSEIASAGRKLNILSDARYRFERGVDPNSTFDGIELATEMILKNCGGKVGSIISDSKVAQKESSIRVEKFFFDRLLGIDTKESFIEQKLKAIGCKVSKSSDGFDVVSPSWRPDIRIKEDLVEEIGRLYGYEKIPDIPLKISNLNIKEITTDYQKLRRKIKRMLVSQDMMEIISWSFVDEKIEDIFGELSQKLNIRNPISSDLSCLRSNLLGNLMMTVKKNNNKDIRNLSIFEIGPVFFGVEPGKQFECISGIRSGKLYEKSWIEKERDFDIFDIKSDFFNILKLFNFDLDSFQISSQSKGYYHPGKSASVYFGKEEIGRFGELHPLIVEKFEVKRKTCAFELDLSKLMKLYKRKSISKDELKVSQFQASTRDFSFEVKKSVLSYEMTSLIKNIDKELIRNVSIFDHYEGEKINTDYKAIAIEVEIQSDQRTLKDDEIKNLSKKIVNEVQKKFSARLR